MHAEFFIIFFNFEFFFSPIVKSMVETYKTSNACTAE